MRLLGVEETEQMNLQLDLLQRSWCERVEREVISHAKGAAEFTTDSIRDFVESPAHPNWFGVLMARMKNQGLVESIGWRVSQRKAANGRPIRVWRIKQNT